MQGREYNQQEFTAAFYEYIKNESTHRELAVNLVDALSELSDDINDDDCIDEAEKSFNELAAQDASFARQFNFELFRAFLKNNDFLENADILAMSIVRGGNDNQVLPDSMDINAFYVFYGNVCENIFYKNVEFLDQYNKLDLNDDKYELMKDVLIQKECLEESALLENFLGGSHPFSEGYWNTFNAFFAKAYKDHLEEKHIEFQDELKVDAVIDGLSENLPRRPKSKIEKEQVFEKDPRKRKLFKAIDQLSKNDVEGIFNLAREQYDNDLTNAFIDYFDPNDLEIPEGFQRISSLQDVLQSALAKRLWLTTCYENIENSDLINEGSALVILNEDGYFEGEYDNQDQAIDEGLLRSFFPADYEDGQFEFLKPKDFEGFFKNCKDDVVQRARDHNAEVLRKDRDRRANEAYEASVQRIIDYEQVAEADDRVSDEASNDIAEILKNVTNLVLLENILDRTKLENPPENRTMEEIEQIYGLRDIVKESGLFYVKESIRGETFTIDLSERFSYIGHEKIRAAAIDRYQDLIFQHLYYLPLDQVVVETKAALHSGEMFDGFDDENLITELDAYANSNDADAHLLIKKCLAEYIIEHDMHSEFSEFSEGDPQSLRAALKGILIPDNDFDEFKEFLEIYKANFYLSFEDPQGDVQKEQYKDEAIRDLKDAMEKILFQAHLSERQHADSDRKALLDLYLRFEKLLENIKTVHHKKNIQKWFTDERPQDVRSSNGYKLWLDAVCANQSISDDDLELYVSDPCDDPASRIMQFHGTYLLYPPLEKFSKNMSEGGRQEFLRNEMCFSEKIGNYGSYDTYEMRVHTLPEPKESYRMQNSILDSYSGLGIGERKMDEVFLSRVLERAPQADKLLSSMLARKYSMPLLIKVKNPDLAMAIHIYLETHPDAKAMVRLSDEMVEKHIVNPEHEDSSRTFIEYQNGLDLDDPKRLRLSVESDEVYLKKVNMLDDPEDPRSGEDPLIDIRNRFSG